MKKLFKSYAIVWAILLVVFNVICFALPSTYEVGGIVLTKFDASFWVAYAFITLAFVGQLVCASVAFKAENLQKLFYNVPLVSISYTGLVVMLVVSSLVMAIPNLPSWVGIIVCVLVLGFTAASVVKASAAAEAVSEIDEKVKTKTQFIKLLTVDAENLMRSAATPEAKELCKKVYEAIRFSDPMSSEALAGIEGDITVQFGAFHSAVFNGENMDAVAAELLALISARNIKCKALK